MSSHTSHQMQLTSLYQYWPAFNEEEVNSKFRQKVKQDIILLLQQHDNLTDREMARELGYSDPNKVRPRRNELASANKRRDAILVQDEKRICAVGHKQSIAWKLSKQNLQRYLRC